MNLKPLCITAALLVFSLASIAQTDAKRIQVGLSASTFLSFVNGDERSHFKSNNSLSFGMQGDVFYKVGDRLHVNSGLEWLAANRDYRDQTAMWPSDVVNGEFEPGHGGNYLLFEVKENYIGVPLLLQYKLSAAENSKLFLITGFKFRQRISLKGDVTLYEGHQPSTIQHDLDEPIFGERTKFKTAFVAGLGFELPSGRFRIGISPVYEMELNKMRDDVTSDIVGNGKGSFLGLRIGIR